MGSFVKYLQDYRIVAQYTIPDSPKQNGVVERCNRTHKDMMKSMMSRYNLQEYLQSETLKTVLYILNKVFSTFVPKTPLEVWIDRKSSLNHFWVWGCPVFLQKKDISQNQSLLFYWASKTC